MRDTKLKLKASYPKESTKLDLKAEYKELESSVTRTINALNETRFYAYIPWGDLYSPEYSGYRKKHGVED